MKAVLLNKDYETTLQIRQRETDIKIINALRAYDKTIMVQGVKIELDSIRKELNKAGVDYLNLSYDEIIRNLDILLNKIDTENQEEIFNDKAAQTINKALFQRLTTDERKMLVANKVELALKKFNSVYKIKPNKLNISNQLAVHLKDSREMVLIKKDYTVNDLYVIVVELDHEIYRGREDIPRDRC